MAQTPRFGIVAQFKNEAMGIREWVDHYRWQGADRILLLDNNSTDDWQSQLKGTEDLVDVRPAPKDHAQNENYITLATPWLKEQNIQMVAILDLDEFLFGTDGKPAKGHLVSIFAPNGQRSNVSQVVFPWHSFGSNGHEKQPASIRKAFTKKQAEVKLHIHSEKAVTWVDDLVELDTHRSIIKGGEVVENPPELQLNHYYLQSKEFFEKVKMRRGNAGKKELNASRTMNTFNKSDASSTVIDTKLKELVEQFDQRGGGIKRKTTRKQNAKRFTKKTRRLHKKKQIGGSSDVTVVTAYYKLSSKHSYDEYLNWGKSLLEIEAPIVIFTSEDMADKIKELRGNRPIHIIITPFEEIYMWKTYKKNWQEDITRDPLKNKGINHSPELYALWSNKWIWMEDAISLDKFKTNYYLWCDFGCFRNGNENDLIKKNFPLASRFQPGKVLALLLNEYSKNEYKESKLNIKDHVTKSVIGGGIWGGDKVACLHFRNSYESMLKRFFHAKKWAGQEQCIMPYIFLEEPDLGLLIQPYTLNISGYDEWFFLKYYLSDLSIQTQIYNIKEHVDYNV
jgi:hypothetical protein